MQLIRKLAVSALTAAVCTTAPPALAQYGGFDDNTNKLDARFYISPMATFTSYDKDKGFEDQFSGMLSFGKVVGRGMNIELTGFINNAEKTDGSVEGEITGYALSFLAFFDRTNSPFYAVTTINKIFYEADNADDRAFSDGIDFGLGYWLELGRWGFLGKGPALRVEARYRHERFPQAEAERFATDFALPEQSRSFADFVTVIGLSIPIGPDPNKPPPPEPEEPEPIVEVVRATTDTDGDGVLDQIDKCPDTPTGTRVDSDGCTLDADGDGILDATDRCPNSPAGTAVMADGCALEEDCRIPEPGQKVDENGCAVGDAVVLEGVTFEHNSDRLTDKARRILQSVAGALEAAPGVEVEIGGHTDAAGSDAYNMALSGRRARAVKRHLETLGIDGGRLSTQAYGETQPIASNADAEGRARNRRVELKVVGQ